MNWARTYGADVINMSFGGDGPDSWTQVWYSNPLAEATFNANQQGIVLIAASGNDDSEEIVYPAGYRWVMAVGATNSNDVRVTEGNTGGAWGSNYGPHIEVVAPGISGYSTERYDGYAYFSGTSSAAPFVAGVAGLIISQARDRGLTLTNDDARHLLHLGANDIVDPNDGAGVGWDDKTGYGRINADSALTLLSPPYTFVQGAVTGGAVTLTWDSHAHTFYNNGGLPSGVYYGVKQYKVSNHVSFPATYSDTPIVWVRERQTEGWSYENPNLEVRWAQVTNVTASGFDVETVVYWITTNEAGDPINDYYPCPPSQATVAYTAIGIPSPVSVTITGPRWLAEREQGTWTANPSGGDGSYTYEWRYRYDGTGPWSAVVSYAQTYSRVMGTRDFELQVKVTSAGMDAYDTHYVEYDSPLRKRAADGSVDQTANIPDEFDLKQNYPNPFNPETEIKFQLAQDSYVTLSIFNVSGERIRTLVNEQKEAGYHRAIWDGRDESGRQVASGIYLYRIEATPSDNEARPFAAVSKMTLLR